MMEGEQEEDKNNDSVKNMEQDDKNDSDNEGNSTHDVKETSTPVTGRREKKPVPILNVQHEEKVINYIKHVKVPIYPYPDDYSFISYIFIYMYIDCI